MELKDILTSAAKAVDDAGVAKELRVAAFTKAVELIAGPPRQERLLTGRSARNASSADEADGAGKLDRIAKRLGLEVEDVSEVYAERDGDLEIVISPSKLHAKKMTA